jgi:hypothetical protein
LNSQADGYTANIAELPPYRALLVVDMKDFSGSKGRDHAALTEEIPRILRDAFTRAGLINLWDERRFYSTTGDGYALGFRPANLPFLLNPFLTALQDELDYRNRVVPVGPHDQPIRMRVSINVGPMTDSGENSISDGSGNARIETHRLLDASPVRDLLARSKEPTCVTAIVSARAFEDAVLSGFADESPDLYVAAPVQVKAYQGTAYLRVPKPSGDLLAHGFRPDGRDPIDGAGGEGRQTQEAAAGNTVRDVRGKGKVVQAQQHNELRHIGIGSVTGNVGSVVTDPYGPVHTGGGDQINAPEAKRRKRSRDDR